MYKLLLESYEEDIKQSALKTFAGMAALKLRKPAQILSSFNPCPSLSSAVTEDRKQLLRLNTVFDNKNMTFFFGNQLMQKHVLAF